MIEANDGVAHASDYIATPKMILLFRCFVVDCRLALRAGFLG
jgi:hypothetical protein